MNKNGKQTLFRHFINWTVCYGDTCHRWLFVLVIVLSVITFIMNHHNYSDEATTYDVYHYEYLTNVVTNIWNEDTKSINASDIPENVIITEAQVSSSEVDFKCSLITDYSFADDPFIEVHISDNFDVEVTHYTEDEYIKAFESNLFGFSIGYCALIFFGVFVVYYLVLFCIGLIFLLYDLICWVISKFKKSRTVCKEEFLDQISMKDSDHTEYYENANDSKNQY